MRSRSRVWMTTLAVVTLALAVAIAPAAGETTVQSESPVQALVEIAEPGILVAKGAGVDVTVMYGCLPGVTLDGLYVEVVERAGNKMATGSGWVTGSELASCAGLRLASATVRVTSYSAPFKPGTALVSAELYGSGDGWWFSVTDDAEIRLSKK